MTLRNYPEPYIPLAELRRVQRLRLIEAAVYVASLLAITLFHR